MMELVNWKKNVGKRNNKPLVKYIPRPTSPSSHKIRPAINEEQQANIKATSTPVPNTGEVVSPAHIIIEQSPIPTTNTTVVKPETRTRSVQAFIRRLSTKSGRDDVNNLKRKESANRHIKNSLKRDLTSRQKALILVAVVGIGLLVISIAIIVPIVLLYGVLGKTPSESSFINISVSACSSTTCIGQETPYRSPMTTLLYGFDGNTNDQSGYASGVAYGLSTPSFNQPGYVSLAISLTSSLQQYVQITNANLAKRSFTIQAWIYPGSLTIPNDFGIFSQCDANSICLSFSIRNARLTLSFDSMNATNNTLVGASLIMSNGWVHVTALYDAKLFQQRIYVNGRVDAVSSGIVQPFQGVATGAVTTIGRSTSFGYGNSYFNGRIDNFVISSGFARSDCQILNDASLVAYFRFDLVDILNDHGFNLCHGMSSATAVQTSGRINQAITFTSSASYFQAQCFPKARAGDWSFSFSLWVNPNSTTAGGTLIHLSSIVFGNGTCYDLLALTSSGNIVAQWMISYTVVNSTQGPVIPASKWTHIAFVYSSTNGVRIFIDGQYRMSSPTMISPYIFENYYNAAQYITVGNFGTVTSVSCVNGSIPLASGPFSGAIDDFRLYNRELNSDEICVLANP